MLNEIASEEINEENVSEEMNESSGNAEVELPELSDAQLQALLEKHEHKVKINGEESVVKYSDLLTDYQMREASNKKFQEANDIRTAGEKAKQEANEFYAKMDKLAETEEGRRRIADAYGIPWSEKQEEPVEYDSPEAEEIASLKSEISELKRSLNGISVRYDTDKLNSEEQRIVKEFDQASEKFPVVKNENFRQLAAQLVLNSKNKLSISEACKQVNDLVLGHAEQLKTEYINKKKEASSKQIVSEGKGVTAVAKNPDDFTSLNDRYEALMHNVSQGLL